MGHPGPHRRGPVDCHRLALVGPHAEQVAADQHDLGDQLVLVIVPAQREDLFAVTLAQMAHDMLDGITGDPALFYETPGHADTCSALRF